MIDYTQFPFEVRLSIPSFPEQEEEVIGLFHEASRALEYGEILDVIDGEDYLILVRNGETGERLFSNRKSPHAAEEPNDDRIPF